MSRILIFWTLDAKVSSLLHTIEIIFGFPLPVIRKKKSNTVKPFSLSFCAHTQIVISILMAWKPLGLHAALEMIQEEATKKRNPRYFRHENDLVFLARGQFGKRERKKGNQGLTWLTFFLPSLLVIMIGMHGTCDHITINQGRLLSLFSLFFLRWRGRG